MWHFLKRKLLSSKGAMDRILVTLLLVIVGVGALVGFSTWVDQENTAMKTAASSKISTTLQDASQ